MKLLDFISPDAVALDLRVASREALLSALVALLRLGDSEAEGELLTALGRREATGSTGVGRGIAVPHCRSPRVERLRLAYGRVPGGLNWNAIDGGVVRHFFLIVAPQGGKSVDYLTLLGSLAKFAKEADTPDALERLSTVDEFIALLHAKGA